MNHTIKMALLISLGVLHPGPAATAQDSIDQVSAFRFGSGDEAVAFRTQGNGWTFTSSGSSGLGRPAVATWSVVPDGTSLPTGLGEPVSPNDLIAFLDGIHHGGTSPGGSDLTQRAWWSLMNSSYERWDSISGMTFNYEPNDDGRKLGSFGGQLGVRGDLRVGGHSIDGQTSPTFLAYSFFPNNADMVIDTDEVTRWGRGSGNYLLFRNMMMHEIGHGIGLNHVESEDINPATPSFQFGTFLMEPRLTSRFDGPQLDEILGAQRLYGDANEKGAGNDTATNATSLGTLLSHQTLTIGADADGTAVDFAETDFVSIDDDSDVDYFRFTIDSPTHVDLRLTPKGPAYMEGPQGSGNAGTQVLFDASATSDLMLSLIDSDGTSILEFVNETGIGMNEQIRNFGLSTPGDYFVRVAGLNNNIQLFQLDIAAVPEPSTAILALGLGIALRIRRRRVSGASR